jgi:predicted RNase H-like HicB family nuclease
MPALSIKNNTMGVRNVNTYIFPVMLEQAENAWHVSVPELEHKGAATWGPTKEVALRNIQEVMQMIVEEMLEDGETLPDNVQVFDQTAVAVSI